MKWWPLLLVAAFLSGCGTAAKPPLPKFALGEAPAPAPNEEAGAGKLRATDVVYFGLTKSSEVESQSARRIIETLQRGGQRVALGWVALPATEQPLLDRWQEKEISAPQLLEQLTPTGRADWLRQALRPDLLQVALGAPKGLLRKIQAGDTLTPAENAALPQDYRPRPEAFDNFVDRIASSPRLRRYNLPRLYRAHLAAEQMIAENIVRFRREHPDAKLLVFLPDDAMINPQEVADFVAQKENVRQMILDRSGAQRDSRPQLLAGSGRTFQIVNRAPETGRHDRRIFTPRLRT